MADDRRPTFDHPTLLARALRDENANTDDYDAAALRDVLENFGAAKDASVTLPFVPASWGDDRAYSSSDEEDGDSSRSRSNRQQQQQARVAKNMRSVAAAGQTRRDELGSGTWRRTERRADRGDRAATAGSPRAARPPPLQLDPSSDTYRSDRGAYYSDSDPNRLSSTPGRSPMGSGAAVASAAAGEPVSTHHHHSRSLGGGDGHAMSGDDVRFLRPPPSLHSGGLASTQRLSVSSGRSDDSGFFTPLSATNSGVGGEGAASPLAPFHSPNRRLSPATHRPF